MPLIFRPTKPHSGKSNLILLAVIILVVLSSAVGAYFLFRRGSIDLVSHINVSPSGKRIAFLTARLSSDPDVRLCLINTSDLRATETQHQVMPGPYALAWAPDESKVVFVSGHFDASNPDRSELLIMDMRDNSVKEIVSESGPVIWAPKFSPDGRFVGYIHDYDRRLLSFVDLASGNTQVLCEGVGPHWQWCWSRDSTAVYFVQGDTIREKTLAGDESLVHGFDDPNSYLTYLSISPDRKRLGFLYRDTFFTLDLEGGGLASQFECTDPSIDHDWSQWGICYVDRTDNETHGGDRLMVNKLDGKPSTVVATGPLAEARWLVSGEIILRYDTTHLWKYDTATGVGTRLFP